MVDLESKENLSLESKHVNNWDYKLCIISVPNR